MPDNIFVYYFKNKGIGHLSVWDGAYYYSYFGFNYNYEFVKNAESCSDDARYSVFEIQGKWHLKSFGKEIALDMVPGLEDSLKNFSTVSELTQQDQLAIKQILFAAFLLENPHYKWIEECDNEEQLANIAQDSIEEYGVFIKTIIPMNAVLDVKQVNEDMKDKHHTLHYDWINENCTTVALSVLHAHKLFSAEKNSVLPSVAMTDICHAGFQKVRELLEQEYKNQKFNIQDMTYFLINCQTVLNDKKFDSLTFFKGTPTGVAKLRKILPAESADFKKMSEADIRLVFNDFLQRLAKQYYAKRGFYWKRSSETQGLYDDLFQSFINTFLNAKKPKNNNLFEESKDMFEMDNFLHYKLGSQGK